MWEGETELSVYIQEMLERSVPRSMATDEEVENISLAWSFELGRIAAHFFFPLQKK